MQVSSTNPTNSIPVSKVVKNDNNEPTRVLTSAADKVKREKTTQKEFENLMPRMIKIISKFSKFQGEVPNIIINALGTGLIAPIFIKYNFLSKTDEDTRTYSAWRQPVSAVLAVITQAGMIMPFNHLVWKMNNKGEFSNPQYNTTAFPDAKYIQEQLKKEGCKLKGKELEGLAKQKYNENIDNLIKTALKKNTIEYTTSTGDKVSLTPEEVKKLLDDVSKKMEKDVKDNIERYETEKPEHKIQRGEYLRHNHEEVRPILADIEKQISEGKNFSEINKYISSKRKALEANNSDKELITIMDELEKRRDNPSLLEKILKLKGKCDKYSNTDLSVKEIAHSEFTLELEKLKTEQKAIEDLIKGIGKGISIKDLEKIIADRMPDNQFVYDVIQKHISNIKGNIKGYNQIIGIVVSVAMLPLTCCLLNYLYPRFMDTFFPRLSNKKKPHNDDYFVKVNGTIPMEAPEDKKGGKL